MKIINRPSGVWGVTNAGFINLKAAEKSWKMFPDLYPACKTVKDVAEQIANGFGKRQKVEIVMMVENTWGE